jgi:hypothetical protein
MRRATGQDTWSGAFDTIRSPADPRDSAASLQPEARPYFERVLAVNQNDYAAQFQLGVADARLGNRPGAIEHLKAACRLIPDSIECQRELNVLGEKAK